MASPPLGGLLASANQWFASAAFIERATASVAIVVGAVLLIRLVRKALDRLRQRSASAAPVIYVVEQIGTYLLIAVGGVAAFATLGLDLTSLAVFGGAVGVGVGLGLQGIVKEFVSGVVLIFDPAIQVGDFVEVEGGARGEIAEIGPRATRLRTNDDLNIIIPNSTFMQSKVTNWTYSEASRRMHVPFSVDADSDAGQVREVVLAAAKALPFTLPDDATRKTQVWLTAFSGAGLEFDLVVWPTEESSRHPRTAHAAYTWAILQALRDAGIEEANDQMDLHVRSLFGERSSAVLKALSRREPATPRSRAPRRPDAPIEAPNDAAEAVFDEADRNRVHRMEPARQRRPAEDPAAD